MKNIFRQFKEKKGTIYLIYDHLDKLSDRISKHHLYMLASGIAFNIMLYMIPLFLMVIFIVGIIFDTTAFTHTLERFLNDYLPQTEANYEIVHTIILEIDKIFSHSTLFGSIGILGLLWVSSILISSIRTGLNAIFDMPSPNIFILYRLKDILLTIAFSVLLLIYSYAIPIINFFIDLTGDLLPDIVGAFVGDMVLLGTSIITSFVLFYLIFRFVPNRKLPRFVQILSTLICVVGIELARFVFTWYITAISNYGKFYGTYAIIVSMALWIYYSALIILLAAEISNYIFNMRLAKKQLQNGDRNNDSAK